MRADMGSAVSGQRHDRLLLFIPPDCLTCQHTVATQRRAAETQRKHRGKLQKAAQTQKRAEATADVTRRDAWQISRDTGEPQSHRATEQSHRARANPRIQSRQSRSQSKAAEPEQSHKATSHRAKPQGQRREAKLTWNSFTRAPLVPAASVTRPWSSFAMSSMKNLHSGVQMTANLLRLACHSRSVSRSFETPAGQIVFTA